MSDVQKLARDYVLDYLARDIDYMDVSEFLDENVTDEEALSGELVENVWTKIQEILDVVLMRHEGEDR